VRHGLSLVPFEFVLARLAGSDDAELTEAYPEHAPAWAAPAVAGGDTKAFSKVLCDVALDSNLVVIG
jgi:hypothetical protein